MKLQIAFDLTDLDSAISIAHNVAPYADILEIGSILIYKYGESSIKKFRQEFPQKILVADAKIADHSKEAITLFANAGADWITVLAGSGKNVIHNSCTIAHTLGKKIILDLLDASSLGQSALESESLGVDALLFHKKSDDEEHLSFLDRWEMVRGNTKLPVFIAAGINRDNIEEIIAINPYGVIVGKAIINNQDPKTEAEFYHKSIKE